MASSQLPGAPSNLSIGGLLAIKQIDTIALANTTSTSLVDIDATTAAITVTVPANGKVLITANPYGWMSGASAHGGIGLREAAADVAGSTRLCFYNTNAQISLSRANYRVLLTGLTPGTTHTYKLAMKVNTTGTLNLGISATEGPTYMEAWAVDQVQMSTQIGTSVAALPFAATGDPRFQIGVGTVPFGANYGVYGRIVGTLETISKLRIHVDTQSGNISVAVYRGSGAGSLAVPTTRVAASGAIACPAAGLADISLGGSFALQDGDWFFLSADNVTARFARFQTAIGSDLMKGVSFYQASSHPAPSSAGTIVAANATPFVVIGVV